MKLAIPRIALAALALALTLPSVAFAQQATSTDVPPAVEKDIRRLMEITGSSDLGVQVIDQMIAAMQHEVPQVPAEFWSRFREKANPNELVDRTIPIYAKHFTHDEIKQLIAFYETPLGRKITTTLPAVVQESMVVGQQWGRQLGMQIAQELEAEGYR